MVMGLACRQNALGRVQWASVTSLSLPSLSVLSTSFTTP